MLPLEMARTIFISLTVRTYSIDIYILAVSDHSMKVTGDFYGPGVPGVAGVAGNLGLAHTTATHTIVAH